MANRQTLSAPLGEYEGKRNFRETPEPAPARGIPHRQPIFVIQEHHATRLHYDFRLEVGGVLKSWAVTKEPSLDPAVKRLAVRVEDHPLSYAGFEGTIPSGHYGAGTVHIWDSGTFEASVDVERGLTGGRLVFTLHGERLNGRFSLVRMRGEPGTKEKWLLIKGRDEHAASDTNTTRARPQPAAPRTTAPRVSVTAADSEGRQPHVVAVTNPDKLLYPTDGLTKADVIAYYRRVAPKLLPFLRDRPVTLERLPDGLGAGKAHFWQKNTPASNSKRSTASR